MQIWYWAVTILILIDGFLQFVLRKKQHIIICMVTILILIDGFLQFNEHEQEHGQDISHNPYFNRWFSAIGSTKDI